MAKKTADEIIKLVETIKEKEHELEKVTYALMGARRSLKDFEDTGNVYIAVSFNHGSGWENIYKNFGDKYPSDRVREAVIEDLKPAIEALELQEQTLRIQVDDMKRTLVE